jgi:hypothetical protein
MDLFVSLIIRVNSLKALLQQLLSSTDISLEFLWGQLDCLFFLVRPNGYAR